MIWASPLSIPPPPPQVHVSDVTHPTFYSTTCLQWYCGASCAPPFISSEPPLRTEPLPDPPFGVMGNPDPAPDRVGPSQPPLNFVDGNGYIVLRGLVGARHCEVGWNKGVKALGSGDEKVVAKNFALLFNAAGVRSRPRILGSPGVGKQEQLGVGGGGASLLEVPPPPHRKCPSGWGPPPNDAGQRHCGECGGWAAAPPHRRRHPPRGPLPPQQGGLRLPPE